MVGRKVRQPIISVLGHVDHGKTLLLDSIRGTAVCERTIVHNDIHGLPGLLFIDTPGHEAFTNLRRRGGALADLAAVVVDINEGFMPQTLESLTILKSYKTPFMLVANKIDLLPGWQPSPKVGFLDSFTRQRSEVQRELDDRIYELVGKLHELGFEAERFDRVISVGR